MSGEPEGNNELQLTIGVPVKTQRRCAVSAYTDCAIFVFGLLILWPSSRTMR